MSASSIENLIKLQANNQPYNQPVPWTQKVTNLGNNPTSVSVTVFLLAFLLLTIVEPPFVQTKPEDPLQTRVKSYQKIIIVSVLAAVIVAAAPYCYLKLKSTTR